MDARLIRDNATFGVVYVRPLSITLCRDSSSSKG